MAGGRPPKWTTPEQLQADIDNYFKSCFNEDGTFKRPVTITGLALALYTSRETLCDYQEKDEFSDTVTRAKMQAELFAEEQLYLGKSAQGPIFALKNFGWADRNTTEHTGDAFGALYSAISGKTADLPKD